jgi:hypothetical protein
MLREKPVGEDDAGPSNAVAAVDADGEAGGRRDRGRAPSGATRAPSLAPYLRKSLASRGPDDAGRATSAGRTLGSGAGALWSARARISTSVSLSRHRSIRRSAVGRRRSPSGSSRLPRATNHLLRHFFTARQLGNAPADEVPVFLEPSNGQHVDVLGASALAPVHDAKVLRLQRAAALQQPFDIVPPAVPSGEQQEQPGVRVRWTKISCRGVKPANRSGRGTGPFAAKGMTPESMS